MRSVDLATAFRRDYKREMKGVHRKILDAALTPILESLASDKPLARYGAMWSALRSRLAAAT
jgi:mRNA interferase YafQ